MIIITAYRSCRQSVCLRSVWSKFIFSFVNVSVVQRNHVFCSLFSCNLCKCCCNHRLRVGEALSCKERRDDWRDLTYWHTVRWATCSVDIRDYTDYTLYQWRPPCTRIARSSDCTFCPEIRQGDTHRLQTRSAKIFYNFKTIISMFTRYVYTKLVRGRDLQ